MVIIHVFLIPLLSSRSPEVALCLNYMLYLQQEESVIGVLQQKLGQQHLRCLHYKGYILS